MKEQPISFQRVPGWDARKLRFKLWWRSKFDKSFKNSEEVKIMTLLYLIHGILVNFEKARSGQSLEKKEFMSLVFIAHQRLKDEGLDLPLPYYWYTDGIEIEFEELNRKMWKVGYHITPLPISVWNS